MCYKRDRDTLQIINLMTLWHLDENDFSEAHFLVFYTMKFLMLEFHIKRVHSCNILKLSSFRSLLGSQV